MQIDGQRVVRVNGACVVQEVLTALSRALKPERRADTRMRARFEEFTKQGGKTLLLNVRLVEPVPGENPTAIQDIRASLVGSVLVIACEATAAWIRQIENLSRRHFRTTHLIAAIVALFSMFY